MGMGGMSSILKNFGFGGFGSKGGRDPFDDDFFGGGFGGFGRMGSGMQMMSEMSSMGSNFGGTSKSVSQSTIIR